MNLLHTYIRDLLILNDCVIIPGFGGFIANTQSAQITNDDMFLPPQRVIAFNPQLTNNDGLLANTIALMENINFAQANTQINSFVKTIEKGLKSEGLFMLPDIGSIKLTTENRVVFEPYNNQNTLSTTGFHSFHLPKIKQGASEIETTKQNISSFKKWLVAGVASIALISIVSNPNFQDEKATLASIAPSINTEKLLTLSADNTQGNTPFASNTETTSNLPKPTNEEAMASCLPLKYHVVVGCFSQQVNAEKQQSIFNAKDYNTKIFQHKGNLIGVAVGSFATFTEAKKLMNSLRTSKEGKSAWVLKRVFQE